MKVQRGSVWFDGPIIELRCAKRAGHAGFEDRFCSQPTKHSRGAMAYFLTVEVVLLLACSDDRNSIAFLQNLKFGPEVNGVVCLVSFGGLRFAGLGIKRLRIIILRL